MGNILITNNEFVYEKFKDDIEIIYDGNLLYLDVLNMVRDKIHLGHRLLTHPLSGSVKPNETPYKSIIISREKGELDKKSLNIIEESILVTKKFLNNEKTPNWTKRVLDDFKTIDLSLISPVIEKINCKI
jgi:hypothetical protein